MALKIPLIDLLKVPDKEIVATSQEALPVADIVDDLVLMKDGGVCLILESTSLNFGLLSEPEQQAAIYSFAALLNSFSFPVEIVVRSEKKDITNYMEYLGKELEKTDNPLLKKLMLNYIDFVGETVKKKNVLSKKFYVVISFLPIELGLTKSLFASATNGPVPYPKSYVVKKAKIALYPKRDHLVRQAGRVGLRLTQLITNDLIELIYNVYNPKPILT